MVIIVLEDISFTIPSETNSRRDELNRPAEHYPTPKGQIRQLRQSKRVRWLKTRPNPAGAADAID
jgi:hypothetical protein